MIARIAPVDLPPPPSVILDRPHRKPGRRRACPVGRVDLFYTPPKPLFDNSYKPLICITWLILCFPEGCVVSIVAFTFHKEFSHA
ncbi:MAG: hypothetical protein AW10_00600 [Candidatus Accumulibacter appositus]|uniref:Uncharacterized protein n=1 Tax=Candidatus Accumulibacter appositus TaxID=1454003 RepID=A0A011PZX3_9PROT|nr:MAG: hypothetical protein AW10_00600 [Candidatus Accumulibacter appositus]